MTIKALFQTFLIHEMTDKTYATTQHKQGVYGTNIDVFLSFLTEKNK